MPALNVEDIASALKDGGYQATRRMRKNSIRSPVSWSDLVEAVGVESNNGRGAGTYAERDRALRW